jgi:hypothetical protein
MQVDTSFHGILLAGRWASGQAGRRQVGSPQWATKLGHGSMEPYRLESFSIDFLAKLESFRTESFRKNLLENIFSKSGIFQKESFRRKEHKFKSYKRLKFIVSTHPNRAYSKRAKPYDNAGCAAQKPGLRKRSKRRNIPWHLLVR